MRFTAPPYVTDIALARGVVPVVAGAIDVADPTEAELAGLHANGFRPVPALPAQAPVEATKPAKGKPADEAA